MIDTDFGWVPAGYTIRTGCDVISIAEVETAIEEFGDRYLQRVFTEDEIAATAGTGVVVRLAARFAAKEAVIKAFAEPELHYPLKEIEVSRDIAPRVLLSGDLAQLAKQQQWLETSLSLSHTECHAMAVVVVLCAG